MESSSELDELFEEIFEGYSQKRIVELQRKPLDRETFFRLLKKYFEETTLSCKYAVVGGTAYNMYISEEYRVETPDWDIKLFDIGSISDFDSCVKEIVDGLKQLIESNEYNTQDITLNYMENAEMYQLQLDGKDALDIGLSPDVMETRIINGIHYATIAFLISQLKKYRGTADLFGMQFKEHRRTRRSHNLNKATKDITIFDEQIHDVLCRDCIDKITKSEQFTGMHLKCDRIAGSCP